MNPTIYAVIQFSPDDGIASSHAFSTQQQAMDYALSAARSYAAESLYEESDEEAEEPAVEFNQVSLENGTYWLVEGVELHAGAHPDLQDA